MQTIAIKTSPAFLLFFCHQVLVRNEKRWVLGMIKIGKMVVG